MPPWRTSMCRIRAPSCPLHARSTSLRPGKRHHGERSRARPRLVSLRPRASHAPHRTRLGAARCRFGTRGADGVEHPEIRGTSLAAFRRRSRGWNVFARATEKTQRRGRWRVGVGSDANRTSVGIAGASREARAGRTRARTTASTTATTTRVTGRTSCRADEDSAAAGSKAVAAAAASGAPSRSTASGVSTAIAAGKSMALVSTAVASTAAMAASSTAAHSSTAASSTATSTAAASVRVAWAGTGTKAIRADAMARGRGGNAARVRTSDASDGHGPVHRARPQGLSPL